MTDLSMSWAGAGVRWCRRCPTGTGNLWGHGGTLPGFETVGASTGDGRQAQLVINSNTTSQESWQALHTTLEVALCDAR